MQKNLTFSIHTLIVNSGRDGDFTLNNFSSIQNQTTDFIEKNEKKDSLKKVEKKVIGDRFICICTTMGKRKPYSSTVINLDTEEEYDNPKKDHEVELNDKFFALVDILKQRLFISDLRRRDSFCEWLKEKLNKEEIYTKSILKEKDFLEKIKEINQINFFITPDLFNKDNQKTLDKKLIEDIWGYEADNAKLTLNYNQKRVNGNILSKLKEIFAKKSDFNNISIVGKNDKNFESIFNLRNC